jgi:hypothetical protein
MGKDLDGTNWITVRFIAEVEVMADNADDAFYHARLKLADYNFEDCYAEIVEED